MLALRKASPSSNVSGSFFLFVSGSSTVVRPTCKATRVRKVREK